jgi:hypothetical protein
LCQKEGDRRDRGDFILPEDVKNKYIYMYRAGTTLLSLLSPHLIGLL